MNGTEASISSLLSELCAGTASGSSNVEVAVFPPAIFLGQVKGLLAGSNIRFGAQTVSEYSQGAYTGELSVDMLLSASCSYTLVGHSERRALFGESSQQVAKKFAAAQT